MIDFSTTVTNVPAQIMPNVGAGRRSLILYAPGAPNSAGGNGDIVYSFTLTGAALVPGAPGTFVLQGGQTVTYGNQPDLYAPPDAIWAVTVRGSAAPLTAMVIA